MNGYRYRFLFLIWVTIFLSNCNHDPNPPVCQKQTYTITPFLKQFEFKIGSYWIYTSPNSVFKDSMVAITATGGQWNYPPCNMSTAQNPNCRGGNNYCYQYEDYLVTYSNRFFEGANQLDFHINYNYAFCGRASNFNATDPRFLIPNASDSLASYGHFSKLENKIDTLIVSGIKYPNVYQMYYSPAWCKFQRIWWCPNIGFVKYEFINSQNQVETWNLNNYHIIQ